MVSTLGRVPLVEPARLVSSQAATRNIACQHSKLGTDAQLSSIGDRECLPAAGQRILGSIDFFGSVSKKSIYDDVYYGSLPNS